MQWIEDLFGVSPDGGDGSLEMLYVTAAFAVMAMVMIALRKTYRERVIRYLANVIAPPLH